MGYCCIVIRFSTSADFWSRFSPDQTKTSLNLDLRLKVDREPGHAVHCVGLSPLVLGVDPILIMGFGAEFPAQYH